MSLRATVLRRLVTEYQQSKSGAIFEMIIMRSDDLLLATIYKQMRARPYLRHIDMRDLYHSAIVSLNKAILSVKKDESGFRVISRIYAYVKAGLIRDFTMKFACEHIVLAKLTVEQFQKFMYFRNQRPELTPDTRAEYSLVLDTFKQMVVEKTLSIRDVKMLVMRHSYGIMYKDIAKVTGSTEQNIRERTEVALEKVKKRYGVGGEKNTE